MLDGLMKTPIEIAIEAMLEALSLAPFYQDYVVRGSFISRQFMGAFPRACMDLDFLYLKDFQAATFIKHVKTLIHTANQFQPSLVSFQAQTLVFKKIWEGSISEGMRFHLDFIYQNESHNLQIDIANNDPLISAPQEQKISISRTPTKQISVRMVDVEMLAAWKLHGLFENLNGSWQSKTLWDLYLLCRYNALDLTRFKKATELAFSSRLDPINILNRLLSGDFGQSLKSNKAWENNFKQLTSAEFIPLPDVILWLKAYLNNIFKLEAAASALLKNTDVIQYRVTLLRELNTPEARQKLKFLTQKRKFFKHQAYYKINHIPTSRLGPSERCITEKQYEMLTTQAYLANEIVIVQEKLDGSCVCAFRQDNKIYALGRAGDLVNNSQNESRRLWGNWVEANQQRFLAILQEGERLCGEWLAMVHGTHYQLSHEPFVAFDLFDAKNQPLNYNAFIERIKISDFTSPFLIHHGKVCSLERALNILGNGHHGTVIDKPEGLIWRLERNNQLIFKAKYIFPDKVDGCYLTEKTGKPEIWNWHPEKANWYQGNGE
jgi:hypothetical protein